MQPTGARRCFGGPFCRISSNRGDAWGRAFSDRQPGVPRRNLSPAPALVAGAFFWCRRWASIGGGVLTFGKLAAPAAGVSGRGAFLGTAAGGWGWLSGVVAGESGRVGCPERQLAHPGGCRRWRNAHGMGRARPKGAVRSTGAKRTPGQPAPRSDQRKRRGCALNNHIY